VVSFIQVSHWNFVCWCLQGMLHTPPNVSIVLLQLHCVCNLLLFHLAVPTQLWVFKYVEHWNCQYFHTFLVTPGLLSVLLYLICSYILRMKEFERERRLRQRNKRIEARKQREEALAGWGRKRCFVVLQILPHFGVNSFLLFSGALILRDWLGLAEQYILPFPFKLCYTEIGYCK
jgi:hypothetical protein